jgi:vitamin B12 transporter
MKTKIFIVAAVIISSQSFSQQDSTKTLDEVILTANKYPQKQSETGKVVTVINKKQLDKSSGKTLGEILNTVAGITISGATNNPGTNLTLAIRGASAGNSLILIDGIPVNDPSVNNNYFDLNYLPIDLIERIEILKGGQSTLYGSDAVAGVINIITKKNDSKHFSANAGITDGSYNTVKTTAGIGGNTQKINYGIQYTHLSSDGFSAAYDSTGDKNFDNDGINEYAANGNMLFKLSKKIQMKLFSNYSEYKTALDASAFTDEKDYSVTTKNFQTGTGFIYNRSNGSLHFNYAFNYVSRDYLDDSSYRSSPYVDFSRSSYIGRTHYAELYDNWKWRNWEFLAGADYRMNNTFQQYFSTGAFGPYEPPVLNQKMSQISPYVSAVYKTKNGFSIETGGRWNHHSEYGNNFTYTINPFYLINHKAKIFVNLYSAYKTPTLYQLFDPSAGNSKLQPEKGTIEEAGFEIFPGKNLFFRFTGFYRNTKNAILYSYNPSTFASLYINASKQENYGTEIEATYKIDKWSLNLNYTYIDGKTKSAYDGTGAPIGKDSSYYNLYRIPKNTFNLNLGLQASQGLFINAILHAVGKRDEFIYGAAPEILQSYLTIDLYSEYKLDKRFKLFLNLKNVTNKKYFDFLGYNSARFNINAGINFSM